MYMSIRHPFLTSTKIAVAFTVLSLFLRLTPEHIQDGFLSLLPEAAESFFAYFILALVCILAFKFGVLMQNKPQKRLDAHGLPEYLGPKTRFVARVHRHLVVVIALYAGVEPTEVHSGVRRSPARALWCLLFPFENDKYRYVAELINADKTFPFRQGIVAPKVNKYSQAVITGYTEQLARYFETVGADLGFTVSTYDPDSMPSIPRDSALGKVLGALGRAIRLKSVSIIFLLLVWACVMVTITALFEPPVSTMISALFGIPFGLILYLEFFSKPIEAPLDERFKELNHQLELGRSNLIIEPGQRQWHALAAQILAITDYTHIHGRPREEALARIELVLRSNIFQIEGINATPEAAYEWARAELYDFSAVSITHPNGYQGPAGGKVGA